VTTPETTPASNPIRKTVGGFRFYIGIPALALYIFVFALFWRPLAERIFGVAEYLKKLPWPNWVPEMGFGILANLLSAVVIAFIVWIVLWNRRLRSVAGTYRATDVSTPEKPVAWGNVVLRYELLPTGLFQPQFRCRLTNTEGVVLEGCAIWTKDQYLVGHYQEVGNLARRRAGAFVMQLDGGGSTFNGKFVFIDPSVRDPRQGTPNGYWNSSATVYRCHIASQRASGSLLAGRWPVRMARVLVAKKGTGNDARP